MSDGRWAAFGGAVYRLALRALPRDFRKRFGGAAEADLRREMERAGGQGGRYRPVLVLVRALADVAWRAPAEWRRSRKHNDGWIDMWMRETTTSARALLRRPGFTTVVVGTLALGIGASVAIFTVVNGILLRPLPFPDSERIVEVRHHAPGLELEELNSGDAMLRFYRELAPSVYETVALVDDGQVNLTGVDRPERIEIARVSASLFDVLRTRPALGRAFTGDEALPDGPELAVLTHDAWRTRFGGDPGVLGQTIELDGVTTEIVGVMPEDFAFPSARTVALVPDRVDPAAEFGTFGRTQVARLAPGVDLDQARDETTAVQERMPEFFGGLTPEFLEQARWRVSVDRLQDRVVGDIRTALWVVLGTVGFVLLIACANVANLFLVRAESRQREVAVRAAMGADRGRLAATFLSETMLIAGVAGALGLALAVVGVRALVAFGPQELPRLHEIGMDARVLGFAAGITALAGLGLGLLPVARYLGRSFAKVLRDGGRSVTDGRERHRARNVLVASQLALAVVLLVGSGLMLRSFWELRGVDVGIDPVGVLTVGASVGEGRDAADAQRFFEDVVTRVAAVPGVESVGATNSLPLDPRGLNGGSFSRRSRPRAEDELPTVSMNVGITAGHFESLDIPILQGRGPTAADHAGEPAVVWVNEAFARQFFDGNALGEMIGPQEEGPWAEIVGVVGNVRHFRLQEDVRPLIYTPFSGAFAERTSHQAMSLTVETAGDPLALADPVRRAIAEADPTVPVTTVRTMEGVVAESMVSTSFTMVLLGIAATVALLLGAVGIYGVISYVVSQRTREIGVRMALGARGGDVRAMVVRQGLAVSILGVAVGLGAAFGLTRLMSSLLFGVAPTDPVTFAAVTVALVGVATLASYVPARRASRVDPVKALVSE